MTRPAGPPGWLLPGGACAVGTPSGVSLAPEGGAHQSITTPSIELDQPGCVTFEPAFGVETTWCLLDGLGRLGRPDGSSTSLRLSTAPVDQSLAAVLIDPAVRERRRRQVVAGAYPLRRSSGRPAVTLAAMGPWSPRPWPPPIALRRQPAERCGGRRQDRDRQVRRPIRPAVAEAARRSP